MTRTKIRKVGLWSNVMALVEFGAAAVANNRGLGFGRTISHRNQLGLLATAIITCLLQFVLCLLANGKEDNHAKRNKRI